MCKMSSLVKTILIFPLVTQAIMNGMCMRAPPSGLPNSTLSEVFLYFYKHTPCSAHRTFPIGPLPCRSLVERFYSQSPQIYSQHRGNTLSLHGGHAPTHKQYQHFVVLTGCICEAWLSFLNAYCVADTEVGAYTYMLNESSQQHCESVLLPHF